MKVIIPAKGNSSRVKNKNWRPFYKDLSLSELKIKQLLELSFFSEKDIFLSCDDLSRKTLADKYKINFLERDPIYSDDTTSWSDVVYAIVKQIPCDDEEEIMWAEVTTPLFNEYNQFISKWNEVKKEHDSIVTVSEIKEFLMNEFGMPLNFQYGAWHKSSQELHPLYSFETPCIMRKDAILNCRYIIGKKPFLYINKTKTIEIDTEFDFTIAQKIYNELLNQ